ncbi:hypothetical protein WJX75_002390 [Coccomyxa subellipsoidea]|uniref:DUF1232 domain-containing protein n=1 Tax=Coccomyxa subellipsoidea TaxID=248742 RepID=A0ABR2Z223_9CHLO
MGSQTVIDSQQNQESDQGHEASCPEHPPPRGCLSSLKRAAKLLMRNVYALHLAVQDPQCGWAPRLLAVIVVAYAVSPIDLIPDFIPVLGILDDLLLLPGLIWLAIHLIPDDVWQHALQRADEEPLLLAQNWVAAAAIFIIWDVLLLFVVYMIVMHLRAPYWRQRWYVWVGVAGVVLVTAEAAWSAYQLRAEKRAADAQHADDARAILLAHDSESSL